MVTIDFGVSRFSRFLLVYLYLSLFRYSPIFAPFVADSLSTFLFSCLDRASTQLAPFLVVMPPVAFGKKPVY